MYTVTTQIKVKGKAWEDTPKVKRTFENWEAVVKFAYNLTKEFNSEVRVETVGGQGHYYSPLYADEFLNSLKTQ